MKQITAQSLDCRIQPNDWPKELRNLAHQFNEMLHRIQSSFIQLSEFSSDIAHELRTPIHNLRTMTEMALLHEQSPEAYQNILESNMHEYLHLSKLIEALLFIARSDHGALRLQKTRIDVLKEIFSILDYYQAIADEKEITFSCSGEAKAEVDKELFKRVISNLMSNALRYTPSHGIIQIKIESTENAVNLCITDTGMGIADDDLSNIFNRFYRVDKSRTTDSGGLGLGLAIVKSIMDLHQGSIKISSQLGKETSVHLQFPQNPE